MRRIFVVVVMLAFASCGKKDSGAGGGGSSSGGGGTGSSEPKPVEATLKCPAGNVVQDGKCVAVITPEKIDVVVKQQTRLDDLAKVLEHIDSVSAPIELLAAFRKLEDWKKLTEQFEDLKKVDAVVEQLDNAVKTMRTFKASLSEASGRLGNLKGELDALLKDTGNAKRIEEVRAQVSSQLRATLEPLAAEVSNTIANAIAPLLIQLDNVGDILEASCLVIKRTGGKDAKDLCVKAKGLFALGMTYLTDFKDKPAKLFDDVYKELEAQLSTLIDAQSKKLLDAAQTKVNDALKLPAAGSGSGSAK